MKKVRSSRIGRPIGASATGLIPKGWKLVSDDPESTVDLDNLDLTYSPCRIDESSIGCVTMRERLEDIDVLGSLGFAKIVLRKQRQGDNKIAKEVGKDKYILFPRTILEDPHGAYRMAALCGNGRRLRLEFFFRGLCFDSRTIVPRYQKTT